MGKQQTASSRVSSWAGWAVFAVGVAAVVLFGPRVMQSAVPGLWQNITAAFTTSAKHEGIALPTAQKVGTVLRVAAVLVLLSAAAALGRSVWRARSRRHASVRSGQVEALQQSVAKMVPVGLTARAVTVRSWRGDIPIRAVVVLPRQAPVSSIEWRIGMADLFRSFMGEIHPIQWPTASSKSMRVEVRGVSRRELKKRQVGGENQRQVSRDEQIVSALGGLVPGPRPKVSMSKTGQEIIEIGYAETTRDQSPHWRSRVVEQLSIRLGEFYRASWNRRDRTFTLEPVPPLPGVIDWQEANRAASSQLPDPLMGVYAVDENGYLVGWQPGDREPHALFTGGTGSGKTEALKALLCSLLKQGVMTAISDPKRRDFAEFLGRPGVVCVATSIEDRVAMLVDLRAEMMRRTSASALRKLEERFPAAARSRSARSAIDEVPIIIVLDELTQHTKDVQKWWASLDKDTRLAKLGSSSSTCPALSYPGEIVQLARAVKLHVAVGMQRADAGNFGGDSTMMRELIDHNASMGQLKPIGSEMQWGDRRLGSEVVIRGVGEGLSNGTRFTKGKVISTKQPGRIKAMYVGKLTEDDRWWDEEIAPSAPDASLIALPSVSAAAQDPLAAMEALRIDAGEAGDYLDTATPEPSKTTLEKWSTLIDSGGAETHPAAGEPRPTGDLPSKAAPGPGPHTKAHPVVMPAPPSGDVTAEQVAGAALDDLDTNPVERDTAGVLWEPMSVGEVKEGQTITIGDLDSAQVLEVRGRCEDEFDGSEVFRLIVETDVDGESVIDLNPEEMLYVRLDDA